MISYLVLILLFTLIIFWLVKNSRKPPKFPPGPLRVPFLGSFPFLMEYGQKFSLLLCANNLVEKYGGIAGFYMGRTRAVIVSDFELLKELFKMEELTYRPSLEPANELWIGGSDPAYAGRVPGLTFNIGQEWKEQRRFVLRNLRDFGFGKSTMEETLQEETRKLVKELENYVDQSICLESKMNLSMVNALWNILVGEKLDITDEKAISIATLVTEAMKNANPFSPIVSMLPYPSLAKLPGLWKLCHFDVTQIMLNDLHDLVVPYIDEHKKSLDVNNPRDFLDVYLAHCKRETDPNSSFFGQRGHQNLVNTLMDLLMTGMETTSTTLLWTILYLIHHPNIQDRCYNEIAEIIGSERSPNISDYDHLPYVAATMHESLRKSGIVYLGVPHFSTADIQAKDYIIPKDTIVFGHLHYIMNDPKYWNHPEVFNPTRFIDTNGRFRSDERVIPFSVGKRYCLGQSLAEKEYFIFLVTLLQHFKFGPAPGECLPSYQTEDNPPEQSIMAMPPLYSVRMIRRVK